MSVTIRDGRRDPWHPDPALKANTQHNAAMALLAEHQVAVGTLRDALATSRMPADVKQNAADFIDALSDLLGGDGAVHLSMLYLLKNASDGIRLRRAAEAVESVNGIVTHC